MKTLVRLHLLDKKKDIHPISMYKFSRKNPSLSNLNVFFWNHLIYFLHEIRFSVSFNLLDEGQYFNALLRLASRQHFIPPVLCRPLRQIMCAGQIEAVSKFSYNAIEGTKGPANKKQLWTTRYCYYHITERNWQID